MVGSACMRFQNHLPSRFEDRRGPLALPVGNVEFATCPVHGNHAGHEESLLVPIAASHNLYLYYREQRRKMLSMTSRILTLFTLLTAALSSEQKMFEPRFSGDNQLARPEGYREWM